MRGAEAGAARRDLSPPQAMREDLASLKPLNRGMTMAAVCRRRCPPLPSLTAAAAAAILCMLFTPSAFASARVSARALRVLADAGGCRGTLYNIGGPGYQDKTSNRSVCTGLRFALTNPFSQSLKSKPRTTISNTFWADDSLYRTCDAVLYPSNLSYSVGPTLPPGTKQVWVRLHFAAFAATAPFDRLAVALFDASANGVLLLSNYSVTADAAALVSASGQPSDGVQTALMKEFLLPASPSLSITLSPRVGSSAFLNGLEVLPLDPSAVYPGSALFLGADGSIQTSKLSSAQSFAVKYRLQTSATVAVGPAADALGRTWLNAQSFQADYFGKEPFISNSNVENAEEAPYFLPQGVAKSNRELGEVSVPANLSYTFPVPLGAQYWLRLFFSENHYTSVGDRVMVVYVNGRTVMSSLDVLQQTNGAPYTAIAVDIVVSIPAPSQPAAGMGKLELQIAPAVNSEFLNPGIMAMEVMRVGNASLAAPTDTSEMATLVPTPDLTLPVASPPASETPPPSIPSDASPASPAPSPSGVSTGLLVLAILGGVLAAVFFLGMLFLIYLWWRRTCGAPQLPSSTSDMDGQKEGLWAGGEHAAAAGAGTGKGRGSGSRTESSGQMEETSGTPPAGRSVGSLRDRVASLLAAAVGQSGASALSGSSSSSTILNMPTTPQWREFSLKEMQRATGNFDDLDLLGEGGFGKVYRGKLSNGNLVAVKRGRDASDQGNSEFETEVVLLSKLRHRHLVSLLGVCSEDGEMILVYEYMAQGPLRRHLYGTNLPPIPWRRRLEVAIGAARGLHYLHTGFSAPIIHRDVKSTNILLDGAFVAKLSDFGLSKLGPSASQRHVSTEVKGSFGYLDPEYFKRQQLTEKSDVYSFGVVLLELICARPAIDTALSREEASLADWATMMIKNGRVDEIIDRRLHGQFSDESLNKVVEVAQRCLADYGEDRPSIGEVLHELEGALTLSATGTPIRNHSSLA